MALVDHGTRTIHCKVVYYGPAMAGKTSNLQAIYGNVSEARKGAFLSIAIETERALHIDFLPDDEPTIAGYDARFHLFTVPGAVLNKRANVEVLRGVDGIIFVADSQPEKIEENLSHLKELGEGLSELKIPAKDIPIVLQYNKRDLPHIMSVGSLDRYLNPMGLSRFESACPWRGPMHGVVETFNAIQRLVMDQLRQRYPEGTVL
jgi:mutual gliding-motility protein MglA